MTILQQGSCRPGCTVHAAHANHDVAASAAAIPRRAIVRTAIAIPHDRCPVLGRIPDSASARRTIRTSELIRHGIRASVTARRAAVTAAPPYAMRRESPAGSGSGGLPGRCGLR